MKKAIKNLLCLVALISLVSCANNQKSSLAVNSSVIPENSGSLISSEPLPSSVISDKPSIVAPSSKTSVAPSVPSSDKPSSQAPSSEPASNSIPAPSSEPVSSIPAPSSELISSSQPVSSAPISSAPAPSSEVPSSSISQPIGVYYHVTFLNYDETTLYEVDVLEGTEAVYEGEEPTKPEDDDYTYTFKGWDKDLTSIISDTTTIAVYTSKSKWSPVIWF